MGSLLHGRYRLSVRATGGVFDDLVGVPVAIGSVSALCQEVGAAVAEPYEVVQEVVREQGQVNVNETAWKQARDRRWLWVTITTLCTLFLVTKSCSAAVLALLLGKDFVGVVGSDRYRAHRSIPVEQRQICWAHLKRNLAGFAERGGAVGDWGKVGVAFVTKVFAA